jgi:MFS family permease
MPFPRFAEELDDLFHSDNSVLVKILAGAVVGGIVGAGSVLFSRFSHPEKARAAFLTPMLTGMTLSTAAIGALVVLLLLLRDVVIRRVENGQRVNSLLFRYFGQENRWRMLGLWFVTILVGGIVVTTIVVSIQYPPRR